MLVRFDQMWFDHMGKRWRAGVHEVPDSYEGKLPTGGCEILDGTETPAEKKAPVKDPLAFAKAKK